MTFGVAVTMSLVLAARPVTLEEVRAASRQSLTAIQAEVALTRAGANRTLARSAILPKAAFQAGGSYTMVSEQRRIFTVAAPDGGVGFAQQIIDIGGYTQPSLSAGVVVNQLLYDTKFWSQMAQTGAAEEAAKGELEEQRLASEAIAVERFYEVLWAKQARHIYEVAVERSKAQLTRAEALANAGKGQKHEVLDARVNVANDAIRLLKWDQLIVSDEADLTQWLAWHYEPLQPVAPDILKRTPPLPAPTLDELLALARAHRPILKATANRVKAAESGLTYARADYFPSLGLTAQYGREAPSTPIFFDLKRQNSVYVGATLTWNFFSGLATYGGARAAEADLVLQRANERQALFDMEANLAREYEVLKTALTIAELSSKNQEVSEEELKMLEQRYAVGVATNLDVRNAQIKLTQVQIDALTSRFDVEISRAKLGRLAGISLEK